MSKFATKFRIASLQLTIGTNKLKNLTSAKKAIQHARKQGADVIVLPECFNSPYSTDKFAEYSETIPVADPSGAPTSTSESPSIAMLSETAKDLGVWIVGGSIPERARNKADSSSPDSVSIFNTCTVFNPRGHMVAKHRKLHLFDIDIPGGIRFKESETLSAGKSLCSFETPWCRIGVGICYDIRFAEMARLTAQDEKCMMLVYPAAFNTTTGPMHWELLQRARAVDNEVFVVTASPARNPDSGYQAWGHSSIVDPWGKVIATTDEKESTVTADIDLNEVLRMRAAIPVRSQRRTDVYNTSLVQP